MNTETIRAELIASFEANIASLQATMESLDEGALGQFIVMCDGIAIDFDGTPGKLGSMMTPVAKATRFNTFEEADAMARKTVNGLGVYGQAWSLAMALVDSIDNIRHQINLLKAGR